MLKSRIHPATVTAAKVEDAEECIYIDRELMKRAGIWPYEKVEVSNINNGARFSLFVVGAEPNSGKIAIGGAAAHLVREGHRVSITSYIMLGENDLPHYQPKAVTLDLRNRPV